MCRTICTRGDNYR